MPSMGKLSKFRLNRTLHGRSAHRQQDVPGHNVFKGYSHPGRGDGIDLFCPAGTPVHAMHSGQIIVVNDPGRKSESIWIEGVQSTVEICTVYAHVKLKAGLHEGSAVTSGQVIGYVDKLVSDPHLHLEVWIDNHAVSGKRPRDYVKALSKHVVY